MNPNALHLLCLASTDSLVDTPVERLTRDRHMLAIPVGEVTALVWEVPREDFEGPAAENRLQDISWLGPQAIRHGEAVAEIMEWSPVLPARFGTLFSSEQTLLDLVHRSYETICMFLEQVRDSEEWAVKVLFSRSEAQEVVFKELLERHFSDLAVLSPGSRYFREQKIRAQADGEVSSWLKGACGKVSEALQACSRDSAKRPVTSLSVEPEGKETIANWAFLVESSRCQDLLSIVGQANDEFRGKGLAFQESGPWPPYSFCPSLAWEETEL